MFTKLVFLLKTEFFLTYASEYGIIKSEAENLKKIKTLTL